MAPPFGILSHRGSIHPNSIEDLIRGVPAIDLTESSDEEDVSDLDVEDDGDFNNEVLSDAGVLSRGQSTATGLTVASPPLPGYANITGPVFTPMGTAVSLGENVELQNEDFLRVKRIMLHRENGKAILRGSLFRRAFLMDRMLRKAQNEVCAILVGVDPNVANPKLESHLVDVSLEHVLIGRSIILTNMPFAGYYSESDRPWKDHSFRDDRMPVDVATDDGVLCCRWKRVEYSDAAGQSGKSGALMMLRHSEADAGKRTPNAALVYWWRYQAANDQGPALPHGAIVNLTGQANLDVRSERAGRKIKRKPRLHVTRTIERTLHEHEEIASTDASGRTISQRRKRSEQSLETKSGPAPALTHTHRPADGTKAPMLKERKNSNVSVDGIRAKPGEMVADSIITKTKSHKRQVTGPGRSIGFPGMEALILQQRTHFDFLAGGGGATTGAEQAGSIITFLLDKSVDACNTLRLAFPAAKVLNMVLGDFFREDDGCSYHVATVHISFPCKTYSGAHTVDGKDDNMNEDAACSVNDILRKTRPKIVTFEQTDAMVSYKKNCHVWRRMIRDITTTQYSLRWRIMDATEHGNASKRNRLIIMAACPGHPLPDFPPPRTEPKMTIRKALSMVGLLENVEDHMQKFTVKDEPPMSTDDTTLPYTITCNGGQGDVHPSGKRSNTIQELALLAGFPWWRRFAKASMTALRDIIGNAVPVGLAEDVYKMVHKGLDEGEAEMLQWLLDNGFIGGVSITGPEVVEMDGDEPEPKRTKKAKATRMKTVVLLDEEDVIMIDD